MSAEIRVLTVQQPWAWAIIHGGKDVENRTQRWTYRGPLAIHAGARLSERGCMIVPDLLDGNRVVMDAYCKAELEYGAIIGVVDLVGVHEQHDDCCESPWAETSYTEHVGKTRRQLTHLVLENPRPLAVPIACKGRLGLWKPDDDIASAVARLVNGEEEAQEAPEGPLEPRTPADRPSVPTTTQGDEGR